MKVYVTGYNKGLLEDEEKHPKITIHFTENCGLLAESNTDIFDVEIPVVTYKQLAFPFLHNGKSINPCSKCAEERYPKLSNWIYEYQTAQVTRQDYLEAKELARKKFH